MKVAVAVLTFRRVEHLAPLVGDLEREIGLLGAGSTARVLVVDNDPDGTGRAALDALDPSVDLTCVVEPRPGIAAARNRALLECAADDVLVFIDDDERPDRGWLAALVATHEQHGPVAVSGPVRTVYGGAVDPWVEAGRFVDRSHRDGQRTGDLVSEAATNNLLLDLGTVRRLGLSFDESLRLSGGEDALFTRQLTRAGGLVRFSTGSASYLVGSAARRLPWQANGARLVARGLGTMSAAVGLRHEEYAAQRSAPPGTGRFSGRPVAESPR